MGEFPSGQREQTVNLSSLTSVVRIHPLPPKKTLLFAVSFFFYMCNFKKVDSNALMGANTEQSEVRSDRKTVLWTVLTLVQRAKPCDKIHPLPPKKTLLFAVSFFFYMCNFKKSGFERTDNSVDIKH